MYRKTGSFSVQNSANTEEMSSSEDGSGHTNIEMQESCKNNVSHECNETTPETSAAESSTEKAQPSWIGYDNHAITLSNEDLLRRRTSSLQMDSGKKDCSNKPESRVRGVICYVVGAKELSTKWVKKQKSNIFSFIKVLLLVLYNAYLGFAVRLTWDNTGSWCEGVKFLVIVTAAVYSTVLVRTVFIPYVARPTLRALKPTFSKAREFKYFTKTIWSVIWISVLIFVLIDSNGDTNRMTSAGGLMVLLVLGYLFSWKREKVNWRHVNWGVLTQFLLGLLILRWSIGRDTFQCLGNKAAAFLKFTDKGSSFVFGYLVTGDLKGTPVQDAIFAFKVLSVIIFFSSFVSILYYFGVMQTVVKSVGWALQKTIGTTACESMNAAGNIFLGMSECPLLIRPYLHLMTKSELHAVMTGGFATIAGSVMAAYINLGVSPSHLLSASVMSAPAALAYSKLLYPETEKSATKVEDIKIDPPKETNALEAASNGASASINLIANVAVNLVAVIALVALVDGLLSWFGSLVQLDYITLDWIFSKLFLPLSLMMGVEWKDKEAVASLIGLKTVVNEFVAYTKLSDIKKNGLLSPRSEAIATFALCGFSNIASMGIQVGALGAMAPERKPELASLALRAMIAGSAACFMTACIAGALLKEP